MGRAPGRRARSRSYGDAATEHYEIEPGAVDLARPFLAYTIVGGEARRRDPFARIEGRLVNPTTDALRDVTVETGGNYSDVELGVSTSTSKAKHFDVVEPLGSLVVESTDIEEYYEFVIWWEIAYATAGIRVRRTFSLFKNRNGIDTPHIPILGRPGTLVPCTDGKSSGR